MVQSNAVADTSATPAQLGRALSDQVGRVIVGKDDQVRLIVVALLVDGHVLLDDVPGLAKTLLARTVAAALGLAFSRIQCTPDLLPADVTGATVFDQRRGEFEFRAGPLFANIVLADEINRATPRTQSAFLEAMQERGVTVDGDTHHLPRPFMVLATQNPIELKGTFPLPEAQLDRFLLRLRMGYPAAEDEKLMLERFRGGDPLSEVRPVVAARGVAVGTRRGACGARLRRRGAVRGGSGAGYSRDAVGEARRQPACLPGSAAGRASHRRPGRARLRDARRRAGVGQARSSPPSGTQSRCHRGQAQRRRGAERGGRERACAGRGR
jgi:ATPase family associated with various cellular activities (AAA)